MDEYLKQRLMMAALAFNITIIVYQIGFNSGMFGNDYSHFKLAIGLVIAAVLAGVAYVGVQMTQR